MILRAFLFCILCTAFPALAGASRVEEPEPKLESYAAWLEQRGIELYGSLELEFHMDEGFGDVEEKDSNTTNWDASLELGLTFQPHPWLGGEFALSWDDGSSVEIDQALITVGNLEEFPLYLAAGKMTLPFGRYQTVMLTDSLPQEIGETKEEAALLGLEWEGLQMAAFAFDGSQRHGDDSNALNPFGADIRYHAGEEEQGLLVGISWVNNLGNSDGFVEFLEDEELTLKEQMPALSAYSQLTFGPFNLIGEYLWALESPKVIEDDEVEKLDRPEAWTAELAMGFELSDSEVICGLSYGGSSGASDLLPKQRLGGVISIQPLNYLRLSVEYLREKDYPVKQGGTGNKADLITFQLATEF